MRVVTGAPPDATPSMLIVFEGIDGSGKTTISNRVAESLRACGELVTHVRANGRLASDVAENIRQLARDQRNLALDPFAELLLYTARESQQLEECVKPALARGELVIADRFLHTPEVLARYGRGLPAERVEPVLAAARDGIEPALTILVDVDPYIARARRRADKIARPQVRTSSRKGVSGASLLARLREGYLRVAQSSERWLVVDNTAAELRDVVARITLAILELRHGRTQPPRRPQTARPAPLVPGEARGRFLAILDDLARREPEVAAYLLGGLRGPDIALRRERLIEAAPAILAAGLRGLADPDAWVLRDRLAADAPAEVAGSLTGLFEPAPAAMTPARREEQLGVLLVRAGFGADAPPAPALSAAPATSTPATPVPGLSFPLPAGSAPELAWALRARLARAVPAAVAASLAGDDSARAWELRDELWHLAPEAVVRSLAALASQRAAQLRERWLARLGGPGRLAEPEHAATMAAAVRGLDDPRAWELRRALRAASPVGALLSLEGVTSERAWRWRRAALVRAPRPVMLTLIGCDDPEAWELRDAVADSAKEVLDSILGMDGERAWALREAALDRWPSTVVKSLGRLATTPRGAAVVERQLARYPGDLSLLRHTVALAYDDDARRAVA